MMYSPMVFMLLTSVSAVYRKSHANGVNKVGDVLLGKIARCIRHVFRSKEYYWFLLDMCADVKYESQVKWTYAQKL